ncbi:kinase-like protein [Lindgomyces ingoldianus]|uniref:Kinase-like protein n=1 Tax=Lindgomyces ingoldianus TaxID=673940 RepID=A0ACB6QID5_9PLEO|nr:kinase-like protein [Lindgomyces ingoldianus]KAF2466637.1 kinase-like protein [Lindgomyces ingoldianus]
MRNKWVSLGNIDYCEMHTTMVTTHLTIVRRRSKCELKRTGHNARMFKEEAVLYYTVPEQVVMGHNRVRCGVVLAKVSDLDFCLLKTTLHLESLLSGPLHSFHVLPPSATSSDRYLTPITRRTTMAEPCSLDYSKLQDLYDAYEIHNGRNFTKISGHHLDVFLLRFLSPHLRYKNGQLLAPKATYRTQYLRTLDPEHLGFLLGDTLHVLFHKFGAEHLSTSSTVQSFAKTAETYKLLVDLPGKDFFSLLVEIAYEYHDRYRDQKTYRKYLPIVCTDSFLDAATNCLTYDLESLLPYNEAFVLKGLFRRAFGTRQSSNYSTMKPDARIDRLFPDTSPIMQRLTTLLTKHAAREKSHPMLESILEDEARKIFDGGYLDSKSIPYKTKRMSDTSDLSSERSFITAPSGGFSSQRSFITTFSHGLSSRHSFITTLSQFSARTPRSNARDSIDTFLSLGTNTTTDRNPVMRGAYHKMLQDRNIIPERLVEIDWSGRGQHAEYQSGEEDKIPLVVGKVLGLTAKAIVESVQCMRVRLVRKTVGWPKRNQLEREQAVQEVQHLYRVQHAHIVRLVGTYIFEDNLAILTYPCADWNLETFMQMTSTGDDFYRERHDALVQFFACLAQALDFMHSFPLKHMDIKPQNLLVRNIQHSSVNGSDMYKIYYTDFGISRSYPTAAESETESWTSFTRTYAAREVILQERRGLPADMFSLGCVYAEMLATILDELAYSESAQVHWKELQSARGRTETGFRAYYSVVDNVRAWLQAQVFLQLELAVVRDWTIQMLDNDPGKRPTARQIAEDPCLPIACLSCALKSGPEDFEAVEPPAQFIRIEDPMCKDAFIRLEKPIHDQVAG